VGARSGFPGQDDGVEGAEDRRGRGGRRASGGAEGAQDRGEDQQGRSLSSWQLPRSGIVHPVHGELPGQEADVYFGLGDVEERPERIVRLGDPPGTGAGQDRRPLRAQAAPEILLRNTCASG